MPHFRALDDARIRDLLAYLRGVVFQEGTGAADSRPR
jgi:hypothetical protein